MSLFDYLSHHLPENIRDPFWSSYYYLTPRLGASYPMTRLSGLAKSDGRAAAVLLTGRPSWLVEYIAGLLFRGPVKREPLGVAPLRRLPEMLDPKRWEADLTVSLVDRRNAARLFAESHLLVPAWIGMTIPDTELALRRAERGGEHVSGGVPHFGASSVQRDMQRIRSAGYTCSYSRNISDIEVFHERYYVATMLARHGDHAFLQDIKFHRQRMKRGGILWVEDVSGRVAGILVEVEGSVLRAWSSGIRDGDAQLQRKGANPAMYYFAVRHAHQAGCRQIDFRASRASLSDGLLHFKRKWGCHVYDKSDLMYKDLAVGWGPWSDSVASLLASWHPIFRHGVGGVPLAGLCVCRPGSQGGDSDARAAYWTYQLPGLRTLAVVSATGWQQGVRAPHLTSLLGPGDASTPAALRAVL